MRCRELVSIAIAIAVILGCIAAHDAMHAVSEKVTGKPVTTLEGR